MVPAIHLAPEFTAKDLPFELAFLFYLCNIEAIKKQGQKTILVRFANSDDDKTEVAKMDIQAWFLHPTDPYVDVAVAKIPDGMANFAASARTWLYELAETTPKRTGSYSAPAPPSIQGARRAVRG